MSKVVCLGPKNSHSYQAASMLSGNPEIQTLGQFAVMDALVRASSNVVIPIENTYGGWVSWVICSLIDVSEVKGYPFSIISEKVHVVRHVLCGRGTLEEVRRVVSHEQALLQCRQEVKARGWEALSADSTSAAAERVLQEHDYSLAAISTREAADACKLGIIDPVFVTTSTRFILFGGGKAVRTGNDKTLVMVLLHDEVGSLNRATEILAREGINMKMIHSSPYHGEYVFFMEIEGHQEDVRVVKALEEFKQNAKRLKVLGSFPRAKIGNGWS